MERFFRPCVAVLLLLVSGCTEKWTKPGASDADFTTISTACVTRATALFPPVVEQVIVAEGSPSGAPSSNCSTASSSMMGNDMMMDDCGMDSDVSMPTQAMIDHNAKARAAEARNCLIASGWQTVKRN
jgi:hypothetical protein